MSSGSVHRELIAELQELKIRHQLTWSELPEHYARLCEREKLPTELMPSVATLRTALLRDGDHLLLASRTPARLRDKLSNHFAQVDLHLMLVAVLTAAFSEWDSLHSRYTLARLTVGDDDATRFTDADQRRYDKLTKEIMTYLFKLLEVMRDFGVRRSPLLELIGVVHQEVGEGEVESRLNLELIREVFQETSQATARLAAEAAERNAAAELGQGTQQGKLIEVIDAPGPTTT